jgi:HTH-type transcriptional regulator / antitoxin HigA
MDIKPIRGEADYEWALRRAEELWNASGGLTENDELDILATLLEAYEREHYPIELPDPIEAIKFRLGQKGTDSRALIGVLGQRTRVYEVMHGKRPLLLNMICNPNRGAVGFLHTEIQDGWSRRRTLSSAAAFC